MKVILLKDIKGVGKRFEEKNVSDGHALNFLIPKKLAVASTGASAGQIRVLKENEEKHREAGEKKVQENIEKLAGIEVVIEANANEKNHLFASITAEKLSEILKKEKGIELSSEYISLENQIKEIGEFSIPVKIGQKATHFKLIINKK